MSKPSLKYLNEADAVAFVAVCGPLFEHSPWIAERTFSHRPFASLSGLHAALCGTLYAATEQEKLQLIMAHPDLVGRLAQEGRLTRESIAEQSAAGLKGLSEEEIAAFNLYNSEYRNKFGFPFVICARENKKGAILAAFPVRLQNSREQEISAALAEIAKIARLRLFDAITEPSTMNIKLSENSYGKTDVRLTKVIRNGSRHELLEFAVDIQLHGDFADSYLTGDNRKVVATDSMKNTVYVLAMENEFNSAESFALLLARHFVATYPQVNSAETLIRQLAWNRIDVDGQPHDHAFVSGGAEIHTAQATAVRGGAASIFGGVTDLLVLKTTRSAFKDFVTDRYRTLKDADDRIFATSIYATWAYNDDTVDFADSCSRIKNAMLKVFATQMSYAVQETMYEMGNAALGAAPEIKNIRLRLPNKHRIPVNLQPFGLENRNEIFVWTDEPYGDISAFIERT